MGSANTERGKNGIIHAMKPHAKSALSLALAIVGGIAADPFDAVTHLTELYSADAAAAGPAA